MVLPSEKVNLLCALRLAFFVLIDVGFVMVHGPCFVRVVGNIFRFHKARQDKTLPRDIAYIAFFIH